jgi:predicted ester cyclase
MSRSDNIELLRRYFDEVWKREDPTALPTFLHERYRRHTSPDATPLDATEQLERLRGFRAGFPDITIDLEEVLADNDHVAFRSTMRGTHRGEFLGVQPTGRRVTVGLVDMMRIEDGRIIEQWGGPDMLDLLRQLEMD